MRERETIELANKFIQEDAKDPKLLKDNLRLEVLLDIRELLAIRETREALKHLRDK
ncbi:hypothetical protein ES703_65770 [subsurface metagenome]